MKKTFYVLVAMFAIVMMAGCDSLNPSERLNVGNGIRRLTMYQIVLVDLIILENNMMITMRTRLVRQKEQSDLLLIQETEYKKL